MILFRIVARVGRLSGGAIRRLEEWSPISRKGEDRTRLIGPLTFHSPVAMPAFTVYKAK